MHLKQGTLLQGGKFEIVRYISSGGFGCTYEARHTLFKKTVAIKEFFVKDFCNRDELGAVVVATQGKVELINKLRVKFIDEAVALYELQHPNIVRVTDVFEENGTAYYVMDYIDGCPLAGLISQKGALSENEALGYIHQVADALQYVHSKNRLHLDIKPQNIMIDNEGKAILIDFGVSKQYDEVNGENTSTLIGSTPGYAPIEQIGNNVVDFRPATDIYALAATLYKALSGVTPLAANLLACGDMLEPLPSIVSEVTRNAVEAAMDLNRHKRPQSIEEFLAKLKGENSCQQVGESLLAHATSAAEFGRSQNGELPKVKTATPDSEETVAGVITDNEETCIAGNKNKVFTVNGVNFTMVAVEGGTFEMGEKKNWYEFYSNNIRHTVTLDNYYIGETLVTQELWQAVMGSNPSYFTGDLQRPVEQVSYKDCETFINKLNSLLANQLPIGRKFRLPTEAQWEYAARGGNRSRGYQYSGSNNIGDVAWYDGNSGSTTHPVKQKQPNELGLYDMTSNVWEWCYDWYDGNYYSNSPQTNPEGPSSGSYRVLRGGCWISYGRYCRVANRYNDDPDNGYCSSGLRLAF